MAPRPAISRVCPFKTRLWLDAEPLDPHIHPNKGYSIGSICSYISILSMVGITLLAGSARWVRDHGCSARIAKPLPNHCYEARRILCRVRYFRMR
jgi:hypothetical protein